MVRPAGWAVLVLGVGALGLGWWLGWVELRILGLAGLVLLLLSAAFLVGRTRVQVSLLVEPHRVKVGDSVAGQIDVVSTARAPMLPMTLDLRIGDNSALFGLPMLAPGASHSEVFVVPTERRSVIEVGPAVTGRGDPLGLLRRDVTWAESLEIFVRPVMIPLESLGAGFLRDLEGTTSQDLSSSDLAFHALREYTPGDDLRHVHWKSSAKNQTLLVRQYLDTRRSHASIVVDSRLDRYGDEDEFELAMSVAASIAVRAITDEFTVSFFCGQEASTGAHGPTVLDSVCRVEPDESRALVGRTQSAYTVAEDTSLLILVVGKDVPQPEVRRAAACFPPEVRKLAIRIDPDTPSGVREIDGVTLLNLASLSGLPGILSWSVR